MRTQTGQRFSPSLIMKRLLTRQAPLKQFIFGLTSQKTHLKIYSPKKFNAVLTESGFVDIAIYISKNKKLICVRAKKPQGKTVCPGVSSAEQSATSGPERY
jgi:hypothetical protein